MPALRFLTCGSADEGTPTLVERLLEGKGVVPGSTISAPPIDAIDPTRREGVTIYVAHSAFHTSARGFVAIESAGHERDTLGVAAGASDADLAVLLVDAREGLSARTRRHAAIVAMLGVRHVVLAVDGMDLAGYDQQVFDAVVTAFHAFLRALDPQGITFQGIMAMPLSVRAGDTITVPSRRMPWYAGPCLVEHLDQVDVADDRAQRPFRMPVRWIDRCDRASRGLAGAITSGAIARGDTIVVAETGRAATVARILGSDGDVERATAGDAVTLTLGDAIDVSRGDVLARPDTRPAVADRFSARLLWMSDAPLRLDHGYLLNLGTRTLPATIVALEHHPAAAEPATTLRPAVVGLATVATAVPVAFDPHAEDRAMGTLMLLDRAGDVVAVGTVVRGLRAATNVFRQDFTVTRAERARLKGHRPAVVWLTGLPSAGKSTIANGVEARLNRAGVHTAALDGDNLRHGLTKDLGFLPADRTENIRRVAEVARLMSDAGLVVLCSFITPLHAERALARAAMKDGEFVEVFVDTPLATCVKRDPKGLYRRALAGEIKDFTGIDQAYEAPSDPDVIVGRDDETIEDAVTRVVKALEARGFLEPLDGGPSR